MLLSAHAGTSGELLSVWIFWASFCGEHNEITFDKRTRYFLARVVISNPSSVFAEISVIANVDTAF